jgi:hypothetical protein
MFNSKFQEYPSMNTKVIWMDAHRHMMLPHKYTYQEENSVSPGHCHLQVKSHLQETGHPSASLQLKVHQPIQIILQTPHPESRNEV